MNEAKCGFSIARKKMVFLIECSAKPTLAMIVIQILCVLKITYYVIRLRNYMGNTFCSFKFTPKNLLFERLSLLNITTFEE
jgi:hypothetical protein